MNAAVEQPDPAGAVHEWWQAWQDKDRDTLARMALADYVEYPGGGVRRNIGRDRILEVADRSFARSTINQWAVEELEMRRHGQVAVCSYYWWEKAVLDGADVALSGFATDVLVFVDGGWRYQSHQVSNVPTD